MAFWHLSGVPVSSIACLPDPMTPSSPLHLSRTFSICSGVSVHLASAYIIIFALPFDRIVSIEREPLFFFFYLSWIRNPGPHSFELTADANTNTLTSRRSPMRIPRSQKHKINFPFPTGHDLDLFLLDRSQTIPVQHISKPIGIFLRIPPSYVILALFEISFPLLRFLVRASRLYRTS